MIPGKYSPTELCCQLSVVGLLSGLHVARTEMTKLEAETHCPTYNKPKFSDT